MKLFSLILLYLLFFCEAFSQGKVQQTKIRFCDCNFKVDSSFMNLLPVASRKDSIFTSLPDSSFKFDCGYLLVPENRKKTRSNTIQLPFIILRSKNPHKKKDPVLFTSGGPGNSSLSWAQVMTRSSIIGDRDCIAFEQRGTRYALPYLRTLVLDSAVRLAYRMNLDKDSMIVEGVRRYRRQLQQRNIDLTGYNSEETVEDIHDLLQLLKIDSVNLSGGSYSGGLMMAVARRMPSGIRSLVLNSPLPVFGAIDEDEPAHFVEALKILSAHVEMDSTDKQRYGNLFLRFDTYFRTITGKKFNITYLEKGTKDSLRIEYTKNELLDIIVSAMLNSGSLKDVPYLITEILKNNHRPFIKSKLDDVFNKYSAPDGMRISVYCSDQTTYNNPERLRELHAIYPWLEGFHINNVYDKICDVWQVPPVDHKFKQAFYSPVPVLIGSGEMDPACSPRYGAMILHYFPNGQHFVFENKSHGVGGKDFFDMTQQFLDHPFKPVSSGSTTIKRF